MAGCIGEVVYRIPTSGLGEQVSIQIRPGRSGQAKLRNHIDNRWGLANTGKGRSSDDRILGPDGVRQLRREVLHQERDGQGPEWSASPLAGGVKHLGASAINKRTDSSECKPDLPGKRVSRAACCSVTPYSSLKGEAVQNLLAQGSDCGITFVHPSTPPCLPGMGPLMDK